MVINYMFYEIHIHVYSNNDTQIAAITFRPLTTRPTLWTEPQTSTHKSSVIYIYTYMYAVIVVKIQIPGWVVLMATELWGHPWYDVHFVTANDDSLLPYETEVQF